MSFAGDRILEIRGSFPERAANLNLRGIATVVETLCSGTVSCRDLLLFSRKNGANCRASRMSLEFGKMRQHQSRLPTGQRNLLFPSAACLRNGPRAAKSADSHFPLRAGSAFLPLFCMRWTSIGIPQQRSGNLRRLDTPSRLPCSCRRLMLIHTGFPSCQTNGCDNPVTQSFWLLS